MILPKIKIVQNYKNLSYQLFSGENICEIYVNSMKNPNVFCHRNENRVFDM